jgi:hypothetical protein
MARTIERIEQDIVALEEAIKAIAQQLQNAYMSYLNALGQAVGQQLVLATYHLCTQGYPENFLGLSLNQRQQLQQSIRMLAKQAAEQLIVNTMIAAQQQWEEGFDEEIELLPTAKPEDEMEDNESTEFSVVESKHNTNDSTENLEEASELHTQNFMSSAVPSHPLELAMWQQEVEAVIHGTISKLSRNTNILLQKVGILPKKLPEPVLESDRFASETTEAMPGAPNLINLVIEVDGSDEGSEETLTQITTINLRLGEIEFADSTVSVERQQIRNILAQLNKLGREYKKKQRERTIAEAEVAWRASWFE